jgi:hypothetical protein
MGTVRGLMGTTAGFAAVMFPAALIVATTYQWWGGAFGAEMASVFPDEGPHYINGLLIKRFLTEGLGQDPMAFAQSFYLHYPKVSIGHWPPLFYVIEALWMFIASESIQAEIFLSSLITAGLATLLGTVVWRRHGWAAGLIAGLAFVTLPVIRQITASLMVDVFVGLIVLAGTLLYIRYLDTGRCIWGVMFGLASSAAILSKGNGLELALLPPLAVLLTARFSLLRRPSFWLPLGIVVVLCGPWTALTYKATATGFMYNWGLAYSALAASSNAGFLLHAIGPVGLVLAAIGFAGAWRVDCADGREFDARCGFGAVILAVFLFQAIVPSGIEPRYMVPALPAVILLAARGIEDLSRRPAAPHLNRVFGQVLVFVLTLLALTPNLLAIPSVAAKPRLGMKEAIAKIIGEHPLASNVLVLVGSSGGGESAFVAGAAAADRSHAIIVARGLKLLSSGDFLGTDYATRFGTTAEAGTEVERIGVSYIVIDTAPKSMQFEHNRQLAEAAEARHWHLLARLARTDFLGETLLYRVDSNMNRSIDIGALASAIGTPSPF